ncbi:MAG: hypothetical protein EBU66_18760 [Bacteroidetes bacterium]|nr:hypothetical protein [Bacteroidota bacterium]
MNNRYERVYEVSLLDDLHNYFPALLYEPDRFRTVSDVLGYIGQNSSRRFNLFDYGRRQYLQEQTIRNQRNTGSPVEQNTFTRQTPIVNRWRSSAPVRETAHFEFDLSSEDDLSLLFPSLRNINRLATVSVPTQPSNVNRIASLFQDIIIHASQELINNTSSASGTVTSVATGNGLQGGTITTSGTLSIACPGINTVGSYIYAQLQDVFTGMNAGSNYSAGTGRQQIAAWGTDNCGGFNSSYSISGTWKLMAGNYLSGGRALACRVS